MTESAATYLCGDCRSYGKPFHGWSCDCDECKGYDERGEPRPGEATDSAASEERMTVVLLVELVDATQDEFKAAVEAVKSTLVPLGITDRIRLHATIHDAAERVMDAFEGRRSE